MSSEAHVQFCDAQSHLFLQGLEQARAANGYRGVASNLSIAFQMRLVCGMIRWRERLADPRHDLVEAVSVAHRARLLLEELGPGQTHWTAFEFESACFLCIILQIPDSEFRSMLPTDLPSRPSLQFWSKAMSYADVALLLARRSGHPPEHWPVLMSWLSERKSARLLVETWQEYMGMLVDREPAHLGRALRIEALFRKRGRLAGWSDTNGGDPLVNSRIVDYRLAAIASEPHRHYGSAGDHRTSSSLVAH